MQAKFQFAQNKPLDVVPGNSGGDLVVTTDSPVEPDVFFDAKELELQTLGKMVCRCVVTREDGKRAMAYLSASIKDGKVVFSLHTKVSDTRDTLCYSQAAGWMAPKTP